MTSIKLENRYPASWETNRLCFVEHYTPEEVNLMKYILCCENADMRKAFGLDLKHHNPSICYESNEEHLMKYLSLIDAGGSVAVKYSRSNGCDYGRYYSFKSLSIACIHRTIRHTILKDKWVDIDFSNCHPVALLSILRNSGYTGSMEFLKQYVTVREDTLKKIMSFHSISRDQAKTLMLRLQYGGSYKEFRKENGLDPLKKSAFVSKYEAEMAEVMAFAVERNPELYLDVFEKKGKTQAGRSTLAYILQDIECKMLDILFNVLTESRYIPTRHYNNQTHYECALSYDGLTVRTTNRRDDLLRKAEERIHRELNVSVRLEYKEFSEAIPITNTPEEILRLIDTDKGHKIRDDMAEFFMRHTYSFPRYDLGIEDISCFNDIYKVRLFVSIMGDRLVKCGGVVYVYNEDTGLYSSNEQDIITQVTKHYNKLSIVSMLSEDEAEKKRKKLKVSRLSGRDKYNVKFLASSRASTDTLSGKLLASQLREQPLFIQEGMNRTTGLLLFSNCIYDMNHNRTIGFDPKYVFLRNISRPFMPRAPQDIMDEVNKILYIDPYAEGSNLGNYDKQMTSLFISGNPNLKRFLINVAPSNSGKGVMTSALKLAFGSFVLEFNTNSLLCNKQSGDEALTLKWLLKLEGSRIAVSNEVKMVEGSTLDGNLIKTLASGGDEMSVRDLYEGQRQMTMRTGFRINCNSLPDISPNDAGLHNRVRHIDQTNTFVDNPSGRNERKADPLLKDKFRDNIQYRNALFWLIVESYREVKDKTLEEIDIAEVMDIVKNTHGMTDDEIVKRKLLHKFEFTGNKTDKVPFKDIRAVVEFMEIEKEVKSYGVKRLAQLLLNEWGCISHNNGTKVYRLGMKRKEHISDDAEADE
jgi:phage/plasmid-associated DNA primase